jgi:hypothetical protein
MIKGLLRPNYYYYKRIASSQAPRNDGKHY